MRSAATAISAPSTPAEKNSILPCPYGWSRSAGRAATTSDATRRPAATTFTIASSASEKSAVEPVSPAAANLPAQIATPAASEIQPARRRAEAAAAGGAAPGASAASGAPEVICAV